MAGGCLRYSTCYFTCSALLLLGVSINDVEASSCQRVIHKKVGDTVELPSCLPTDGVTMALWRYGKIKIAEGNRSDFDEQFKGRLELNSKNLSLTVRGLTLQDSGNFSFVSEVNERQRETVIISLLVHEPITKQPSLTSNSTWHPSNESCTVFLECSVTPYSGANYNWTVRNETRSGSRLQYIIRAQDGDTEFTCTVYNFVSDMSASQTVTCSNATKEFTSSIVPLIIGLVIGILLSIVLLLSLLCYTKSKGRCCSRRIQSQTQVNPAETQEQVYSSLLHGDGCVYETMRGQEDAGAGERSNQYVNVTSAGVHG